MRRARLLLLGLVLLAGCGAEPAAVTRAPERPGWTAFTDAAHGLDVRFPSDWHRARRSLTPALTDPAEVLTLATFPLRRGPHRWCAQVPEQALRDLGPRDVLLTLQERHGGGFGDARPTLGPATATDFATCVHREGAFEEHWTTFGRGGRSFRLYAALGREVTARRRAQLRGVVRSLRVRPLVAHGEMAVVPPAGWYVDQDPLTGFREIAVSSYRVPDGPADPNCTPRRAIDALPRDGALLYVVATDSRRGGPRPAGATVLRAPERPYECMGVSRRAHWAEHGQAYLANLYLGPDAPASRRAELARAFDSLVVRP